MRSIELKKKIGSTKNTRKITKALQLVAASKMKRFQREAESSRAYAWDLIEALRQVSGTFETLDFAEQREDGKTLFVLITSDKGLCGALNTRLVKKLFRSEEWKGLGEQDRLLMTVGKKSAEAARINKVETVASFEGVDESMTPLEAIKIIEPILELWESKEVKKIIVVSPHFVNAFTSYATLKTYLPFSIDMVSEHLAWEDPEKAQEQEAIRLEIPEVNILFEPSEESVIEKLSLQVVQMLFIQAFFELKASEYSSRMVAMKQATEAAEDIIHNLTLQFNKARQAAITQSLAELSAAGDAIN